MSVDIDALAASFFASMLVGRFDLGDLPSIEGINELSPREALAVQMSVLAQWEARGESVGGWKAGLTTREARDSMGRDFRPFGYILASRIFPSGASVDRDRMTGASVEPEVGLVIGRRLDGAALSGENVRRAVRAIVPAFELNERRIPEEMRWAPVRIADDLAQWGIVTGPEVPVETDLGDLAVTLSCDGTVVAQDTAGPEVIDDPFLSLARIARELAAFGRTIEPGQVVITGSLLPPTPAPGAGTWHADFRGLGSVSFTFA